LSDKTESLDILDPNSGRITKVNHTRGSTMSCYTQPGMGVITVNNTLTAVICPVNFYGAAVQRNGLLSNPCMQCPTGTVTAGDARATEYKNAAGEVVAISEGGYYDVEACVTPPGALQGSQSFEYTVQHTCTCGSLTNSHHHHHHVTNQAIASMPSTPRPTGAEGRGSTAPV
jgi:hypothetical protein